MSQQQSIKQGWPSQYESKYREYFQKYQKAQSEKQNYTITIKQYCNLSEMMVKSPHSKICSLEGILAKPIFNFQIKETKDIQIQSKIRQVQRIMSYITNSWQYLIQIIHHKQQDQRQSKKHNTEKNQYFSEADIQKQLSRIKSMLNQIKKTKYNFQIFNQKQQKNQHQTYQEYQQQITFIKLLNSILKCKTDNVKNQLFKQIIQNDQNNFSKMKITEYYNWKKNKNTVIDKSIIEAYEQTRKFNIAVLKYVLLQKQQ